MMSILDWTIYVDRPVNLDISTEEDSPIVGAGSLSLSHTGTTLFSHANLIPSDTSGYSHGIASAGRLRTIWQVDVHEGSAPQTNYFGLSALQSQDGLVGSGACYALLVVSEEGLENPFLCLHKFSAGLTNGLTVSSLDSIPYPGEIGTGVPFTLELDWVVDIFSLGGVLLIGKTGTETDFSDLTAQISYVDTISPLVTSAAEGIIVSCKNNSSLDTKKILFDNTTLFELV